MYQLIMMDGLYINRLCINRLCINGFFMYQWILNWLLLMYNIMCRWILCRRNMSQWIYVNGYCIIILCIDVSFGLFASLQVCNLFLLYDHCITRLPLDILDINGSLYHICIQRHLFDGFVSSNVKINHYKYRKNQLTLFQKICICEC